MKHDGSRIWDTAVTIAGTRRQIASACVFLDGDNHAESSSRRQVHSEALESPQPGPKPENLIRRTDPRSVQVQHSGGGRLMALPACLGGLCYMCVIKIAARALALFVGTWQVDGIQVSENQASSSVRGPGCCREFK